MTETSSSDEAKKWIPPAVKPLFFLLLIYAFLVSIKLLSGSLKLLGGDFARWLLEATSNPFIGLFTGIIVTSIVQSSSATTSIVVSLGQSSLIPLSNAIPIIMGANIGTSVTNLLVSLGYVTRKTEFRRALGGAVVHDLFNLIAVIIFFPLELTTHFIQKSSLYLTELFEGYGGRKLTNLLDRIIEPIKKFIFDFFTETLRLPDITTGIIVVVIALVVLFLSLFLITRLMRSLVVKELQTFFNRFLFRNAVIGFLLGMALTAVVQSSSVTTSVVVPLVGAGILSIEQIFPYTLGANMGTTITAILASFVKAAKEGSSVGITIAFSHLLFNIFGILVLYPLRIIPISIAKEFARLASEKKWYALFYILLIFFIIPILMIVISRL